MSVGTWKGKSRLHRSAIIACLAATWPGLLGCADEAAEPPPSPPAPVPAGQERPWFVEAAQERGLRFRHDAGDTQRYFMPEIMVGGGALFDMDADGDLDAYLVQSGSLLEPASRRPGNRLYRNRGDGTFEDVTEESGTGDRGYGCGVATGDYDGDGDVDLYVTNVGPNVLLANDGTGRFTDVTDQAGVGDAGWGASAVFFDYDRDGDLDLFVCNYLIWSVETKVDCQSKFLDGLDYCGPQAIDRPMIDVLYRNNGDLTFTDVTGPAGLGNTRGTGLGVVVGDFDGDGWEDLFVANDGWEDRLWINQGDGRFEERALLAGCAVDENGIAKAGMGVTATDLDDDGDLDVMVCNLSGETDSVFRNQGGYFADTTALVGIAPVSQPFTRFGVGWVDFDNDGCVDLYQANGRVKRHEKLFAEDVYAEPNLLFRGRADGTFGLVDPRGGTSADLIATSRAAVFGDVDNDGGIDVLVVNKDAEAHLLMNVVEPRGHWLLVRIVDERGRDAIGARLTLTVGERRITRSVRTTYSYLAANDPRIHLGLGEQPRAGGVIVRWVDGALESFGDLEADRVVTLRRGAGREVSSTGS